MKWRGEATGGRRRRVRGGLRPDLRCQYADETGVGGGCSAVRATSCGGGGLSAASPLCFPFPSAPRPDGWIWIGLRTSDSALLFL